MGITTTNAIARASRERPRRRCRASERSHPRKKKRTLERPRRSSGSGCRRGGLSDRHDGEEWTNVEAFDAESAALEYVEERDGSSSGDLFVEGEALVVHVKDENGIEQKFSCTMELEPSYYAEELDRKPEPESDIPV